MYAHALYTRPIPKFPFSNRATSSRIAFQGNLFRKVSFRTGLLYANSMQHKNIIK